ncbi:hypothetical protein C8R46DRAFT_36045 [Mycena filopes]|nr:hypothetical protein C8R46DRAFT_36045 [Mycena filopes]
MVRIFTSEYPRKTAETMVRTFARFLVLVTYGPLSIEIASKPGTFSHVHTNQQPPPSARCARRTFLTSYRDQSSASPPGMYVRGLDFLPRRFYQASINPKANHALDDDSLNMPDIFDFNPPGLNSPHLSPFVPRSRREVPSDALSHGSISPSCRNDVHSLIRA